MHPRPVVAALGLLVVVFIAMSTPRRVGDGNEYLAMAANMAALRPPWLAPADVDRIDTELVRWQFTGLPLTLHRELRDAAGRQDFFHFWFYPALAVPGIWLATAIGAHPNYAFAALNTLLFLAAAWVVSRRLTWWLTAALFLSPVLWWTDKAHTEVFTFSLLAVAFARLREAPWWSMVALGAASTQNPPIALALAGVGLTVLAARKDAWRDLRVWLGGGAALVLALIHPAYYLWRWNLLTPQLIKGTLWRWPSVQEWGAVLWDPNLGLAVHAPLLVCTVAASAAAVVVAQRSRLAEMEVWLSLATAAVFLVSFAQSTNMNSGATPGLSRYGVWLVPLMIPVFQRAGNVVRGRPRIALAAMSLASCAWCVVAFQPRVPESYCAPSRAARVVWERWPWLDNPLPEVFAERLSSAEPGLAPVATPGCTKVLLIDGQWPVPCRPRAAPEWCRATHALCYANRVNDGYEFRRAARPAGYSFERRRTWVWDPSASAGVERSLRLVRWRELRLTARSAPGAMLRDAENIAWTYGLESERDLLVYVRQPRPGASLTLLLPGPMTGAILDADTGQEIEGLRIEGHQAEHTKLSIPAGMAVAVALHLDERAAGQR
jgi:hypothetical protein